MVVLAGEVRGEFQGAGAGRRAGADRKHLRGACRLDADAQQRALGRLQQQELRTTKGIEQRFVAPRPGNFEVAADATAASHRAEARLGFA